jgi:hypothetical protein
MKSTTLRLLLLLSAFAIRTADGMPPLSRDHVPVYARPVVMKTGPLTRAHPAVTIVTVNDGAESPLAGRIGYAPITSAGFASPRGYKLPINDKPLDRSIHGNDFWQTDSDATTKCWSQTFNVPLKTGQSQTLRSTNL